MLRRWSLPLLVLVTLLAALPGLGATTAVRVRSSKQANTTEGTVEVRATPESVYAVATDYARWGRLLSDVKDVRVLSGGRENAVVRFTSLALDLTVAVRFANVKGRALRFELVDGLPGGRCHGEFVLTSVENGAATRVDGKLFTDVVGPISIFVSNTTLRTQREAKLRSDLRDLLRHFSK